jgi:hypothetical protein
MNFSDAAAQMALVSSRFAKIFLLFFEKSENAESYLSVVMPRDPATPRLRLRQGFAGACTVGPPKL